MGTWGTRNFENDGSQDWVFEMMDNKDGGMVADTLQFSLNKDGVLDTSECEDALAAAEVVAALAGKASDDFPEDPLDNLDSLNLLATPALRKLAVAVVEKIRVTSEMKDVRTEEGQYESWDAVLADLVKRLSI
ncbi:DUF4259 domain-containing protein [Chitinophaga rhizophila]|uniref:DUF4259 domain-containing protein n=1 Tax=Chitinophaga rhizophila TaxID=2866212 RepID=A0ABS7GIT4_9BACT|nr:DUF4259 domain-containing protein [Chitinophaga rhizophila]MBW8687321.1 DUF4259 domain-containing protein [Chitinophaga rhizophila]